MSGIETEIDRFIWSAACQHRGLFLLPLLPRIAVSAVVGGQQGVVSFAGDGQWGDGKGTTKMPPRKRWVWPRLPCHHRGGGRRHFSEVFSEKRGRRKNRQEYIEKIIGYGNIRYIFEELIRWGDKDDRI